MASAPSGSAIDIESLLTLARSTGLQAAEFVRSSRPAGRVNVVATKTSSTDVVTEIDRRCESLIRQRILSARPEDSFIGEEGDDHRGTSAVEWVVDPIDGTVNFVYNVAAYAVSIAAKVAGEVVVGHVVNVATGESWGAIAGAGSWRYDGTDRHLLIAPEPGPLAESLVATGFSYLVETRTKQAEAVAKMLPQVRDIRRIGAAALDLCGLAEGRFDAYVEEGLQPWDLAAGGLVASEAGLVLRGLDGPADGRLTMAAHRKIAEEYFALIRACGF